MKKGILHAILVLLPLASYAEVATIKIPLNGTVHSVNVDASTKELIFYALSSGNSTSTIGVELDGPGGAKATVEAKVLKGAELKAVSDKSGWFPIGLTSVAKKSPSTTTTSSTTSPSSSDCLGIDAKSIAQLVQLYSASGLNYSAADICKLLAGAVKGAEQSIGTGYQSSTSLNLGQAGSLGFLQKNACAPKGQKTLVRVSVDLSKVPADQLAANATIAVGLKEYVFSGSRAASVKPTSDGKFAPQPLLLMASVGGYAGNGESVRVISWKNNKPSKPLVLKVSDYVYYRGLVLSRIVASKALHGGKGTFELTNGQQVYGVCLNRSKTRQRVNGYPG